MISAPIGSMPKVIGSSMVMVAIGPTPGSTPISVPIRQPRKHSAEVLERERDAQAQRQIVDEIDHESGTSRRLSASDRARAP